MILDCDGIKKIKDHFLNLIGTLQAVAFLAELSISYLDWFGCSSIFPLLRTVTVDHKVFFVSRFCAGAALHVHRAGAARGRRRVAALRRVGRAAAALHLAAGRAAARPVPRAAQVPWYTLHIIIIF